MRVNSIIAAVTLLWAGTAAAAPQDYRFEPVTPQVAASKTTTVAVRLIHLPDGKPVTGAVVFQPKMEMPMSGMAPMATTVKPAASDGSGTYSFVADLSMAGPWTLTVSAKVQGEPATITGSVSFTAVNK
jgi:hypothetical protein